MDGLVRWEREGAVDGRCRRGWAPMQVGCMRREDAANIAGRVHHGRVGVRRAPAGSGGRPRCTKGSACGKEGRRVCAETSEQRRISECSGKVGGWT